MKTISLKKPGVKFDKIKRKWVDDSISKTLSKKMPDRPVATLCVHGIPEMSVHERQSLVMWLKRQIETIRKNHGQLAGRWTARIFR